MARLYMLLLLTLRGNPIIYQGEELGLPQANVPFSHLKDPEAIMNWPKTLGRDGARTPIPWEVAKPHAGFSSAEPWLPVDPEHAKLAVDQQQGNDSMLRFTSEALAVRKRFEALLHGKMSFHEVGRDTALVVRREASEGAIIELFNFGDAPFAIPPGLVSSGDVVLSSRPLKENLLQDQAVPARAGVWVRVD